MVWKSDILFYIILCVYHIITCNIFSKLDSGKRVFYEKIFMDNLKGYQTLDKKKINKISKKISHYKPTMLHFCYVTITTALKILAGKRFLNPNMCFPLIK